MKKPETGEEDLPPGFNFHKHKWKRIGTRGRKIIHERLYQLLYDITWISRSVPKEARHQVVYEILVLLEMELQALDVFQPAINEAERHEAESKARGRGRPSVLHGLMAHQADAAKNARLSENERILEAGIEPNGFLNPTPRRR